MKKVLIVSPSFEEEKILEAACTEFSPGALQSETTASFGQPASYWIENGPDLLVIKMPVDDTLQAFYYNKLRHDVPKSLPLIFVCDVISASLMQISTQFSKVRILKSPVSNFDFFRAAIDLTDQYSLVHAHPRYQTSQEVQVTSDLKAGQVKAVMKNISVSGAFFETSEKTIPFDVGDAIRINAKFGEPPRELFFEGSIVWKKNSESGGVGCGIQFIDSSSVMEKLLKD